MPLGKLRGLSSGGNRVPVMVRSTEKEGFIMTLNIFGVLGAAVLFFASLIIIAKIYKRKAENGKLYTVLLLCLMVGLVLCVVCIFSLSAGADTTWLFGLVWAAVETLVCLLAFKHFFWDKEKKGTN